MAESEFAFGGVVAAEGDEEPCEPVECVKQSCEVDTDDAEYFY